ncbi:MAG: arsenate reductase (glutaredoxin) [Crocinitomicaceae bacterium]|jgi:arsenate reductase
MKILHNPQCSKSREALSILQEKGEKIEIIEYLKNTPSVEELKSIIKMIGVRPEEIVRKGEAIYKELYKGKVLSDEEWIEAMVKHPKLIERPIVIKDKKAIIGRPPLKIIDIL